MKIALISCVKTKIKTNKLIKANQLYNSDLFKKSLKYCLKNYDKTYILSAKYGLLETNEMVFYYEKTLNKMSKNDKEKWYKKVTTQLKKKNKQK